MNKIAYSLFTHKALYTFAKEVLAVVKSAGVSSIVALITFIDKAEACFQDFDQALSRDYIDPFTVKINEADRQRDQRFLGFKNYIEACSYRKDDSWQEAAMRIKAVIERYGNDLYRYSFPEESAALQNMMSDLQSDPLKEACTILTAGAWLNELSESQGYFEGLMQERNSQSDVNDKTLMETRKPLVKALRNLLKMVELQQQVEDSDALTAAVNQLNNLIANSMSSARLSRSLSDRANIES